MYIYIFRVNIEQSDAERANRTYEAKHRHETYDLNNTRTRDKRESFLDFERHLANRVLHSDFWHFSRSTSIYIYSTIIVLLVVISLGRSLTFFTICMRASTKLHDNMFVSITRATMRFFNTNTAGRILNRFSKDMGAIDELLPAAMIDCLQIGLSLLGIIVVVALVNPWLMIPTSAIGVIFYLLRVFYLKTSRNIKRLEGVSK